jgi:hypothetical protein
MAIIENSLKGFQVADVATWLVEPGSDTVISAVGKYEA